MQFVATPAFRAMADPHLRQEIRIRGVSPPSGLRQEGQRLAAARGTDTLQEGQTEGRWRFMIHTFGGRKGWPILRRSMSRKERHGTSLRRTARSGLTMGLGKTPSLENHRASSPSIVLSQVTRSTVNIRRLPSLVFQSSDAPSDRPIRATPIGVMTDIRPHAMSASCGKTSVTVVSCPVVSSRYVTVRPIATTPEGSFASGTTRARPISPSNRSARSGLRFRAPSASSSSRSRHSALITTLGRRPAPAARFFC